MHFMRKMGSQDLLTQLRNNKEPGHRALKRRRPAVHIPVRDGPRAPSVRLSGSLAHAGVYLPYLEADPGVDGEFDVRREASREPRVVVALDFGLASSGDVFEQVF